MVQITDTPARQVDWAEWLRRWDAQQSLYMTTREERFESMLDALEATVAASPGAQDEGGIVALAPPPRSGPSASRDVPPPSPHGRDADRLAPAPFGKPRLTEEVGQLGIVHQVVQANTEPPGVEELILNGTIVLVIANDPIDVELTNICRVVWPDLPVHEDSHGIRLRVVD